MKSYLLTIFSFIITAGLFSQQTHFPDSNAVWSVLDFKYVTDGDSTVNGKEYIKFYSIDDTVITSTSQKKLAGLIREDTNTRKVWGIYPDSAQEMLLYDFSLEKGDTIKVTMFHYGFATHNVKVDSIDTININGINHKRLHLKESGVNHWGGEFWIEGIGSNAGPLSSGVSYLQIIDGPLKPLLICFERNGQVLFDQKDVLYQPTDKCYSTINVSPEPFRNLDITLFPNPTSNQLRIQSDLKISFFKILSVTGQTIKAGTLSNKTISVNALNSGVYFLEITTQEGKKGVERFVVE